MARGDWGRVPCSCVGGRGGSQWLITERWEHPCHAFSEAANLNDRSLQALDSSALAFRCAGCSTSRFLFHYPALATLHHCITYIHHPLTVLLMLLIYTCHYFNLVVVLHSIMLSLLFQSSPSPIVYYGLEPGLNTVSTEQYQQY